MQAGNWGFKKQAGVASKGLVKARAAEVATVAAEKRNSIPRACTDVADFDKLVGTFALLVLIIREAVLFSSCRFTLLTLVLAIFFPMLAEPGVFDARFFFYLAAPAS
jgi:hypothetical protein